MKAQYEQQNELHATTAVVMHRPGLEVFIGSLHPSGSLFECSVGVDAAREAHENFAKGLQNCGVKHCFALPDILASAPRDQLVALAMKSLKYDLQTSPDDVVDDAVLKAEAELLSDKYKQDTLSMKTPAELVTIILTNPTVHLHRVPGGVRSSNAMTVTSVTLNPVSNLVFARDQQIVTARGLVIGALKETPRENENALLRKTFEFLGVPAVGVITRNDAPGASIVSILEGGDYLAAPNDLAFLGAGLRTNNGGAAQLMGRGLLGVRRMALVRDDGDRQQKRMHLDTIFNIVDEHHCTVWEWAITHKELQRRVALYECDHAGMTLIKDGHCPMCCAADDELRAEYLKMRCPKCGKAYSECSCEFVSPAADGNPAHVSLPERVGTYKLVREGVELTEFLKSEGYSVIIPITEEEQTDYMVNYLNLGRMPADDGKEGPVRLLSVHPGLEKKLRDAGLTEREVIVESVDYRGITRMYGAAHCSSQAFRCPDISRFAEYSALFDEAQKRVDAIRAQNKALEKNLTF